MCIMTESTDSDGIAKDAKMFLKYLSEFRWRNFHRNDDKLNALMCSIVCVAILFHVLCQYTTFTIALIIYAAML